MAGVELDSSAKQGCLIKALNAFSVAFSRLSCSVCFLICSISLASCCLRSSYCLSRCPSSGSRRQLSVDKNCRQRSSDQKASPLLIEGRVYPARLMWSSDV